MENGVISHICSSQQSTLKSLPQHLKVVTVTGQQSYGWKDKQYLVGTSFHVSSEDHDVFVVPVFGCLLFQERHARILFRPQISKSAHPPPASYCAIVVQTMPLQSVKITSLQPARSLEPRYNCCVSHDFTARKGKKHRPWGGAKEADPRDRRHPLQHQQRDWCGWRRP